MKYISKFTFSIVLTVLLSLTGNAQVKTTAKKDSIPPKTERYGLRLGVDLFKLSRSFYEKDYRGLELVGDYRLTRKHYLAAEIGNEDKTVDDDQVNFTTKGTYLKIGFDYNSYQNWLDMENIISVGLRYGISSFSQNLNSYQIYDPNNSYFGVAPTVYPNQPFKGLSAQWIEVVAGMKAEVFNNVFVGFSFRLNRLVTQKQPNNFENLYIPGFNRTYNGDFGVGFNYTVSYFIPLYKSTVKAKDKAEEKAKKAQKK
ncbi:hypothetical protein HKT18_11855 [Flavobacterium sp. IMCC34852]|uniref:Outer membrane protein beta-barrel domain-containing protein n=1 Tax=Flavobacterium rivulicola TaxID=2732161 RepID=A0A7Y3RAH1_9FLAO|nr:DUF6048 family protein [Flavobacterium sp. IMCC34852]NNT72913.1 hypothetical protein [Flavobacterium sp. IMCC34852]